MPYLAKPAGAGGPHRRHVSSGIREEESGAVDVDPPMRVRLVCTRYTPPLSLGLMQAAARQERSRPSHPRREGRVGEELAVATGRARWRGGSGGSVRPGSRGKVGAELATAVGTQGRA